MLIQPYLAMTGAEMKKNPDSSHPSAWMACHFSPYGLGLSNLPAQLPEGSILMVDDITPINGHDPDMITRQLTACIEDFHCRAILLDFQRPGYEKARALARYLSNSLPCPVAVSELYAADLDEPVFLSPIPCHVPPEEAVASWKGRELWLDLETSGQQMTITEEGCTITPLPCPDSSQFGFPEETLHCHYSIQTFPDAIQFSLWRTLEDWASLAKYLGATTVLTLYQEFLQVGRGVATAES